MPTSALRAEPTDYELLDAGGGRRLERFGPRVVDRPAPGATEPRHGADLAWWGADLRFDARDGGRWVAAADLLEPWTVRIDGLALELRPTASGGLGVFPEHAANLAWVKDRIAERIAGGSQEGASTGVAAPTVLNLFAHTGLTTLAAARAGAAVTHVDAARTAVAWARRNAELSGLVDRPIRWLVDDAAELVARAARRGQRYDGIVLDPPSFGRSNRRRWRLADALPDLLAACRAVAADDAFLLVTAHSTGMDGADLARLVDAAFGAPQDGGDTVPLRLAASSGADLHLGWAVRRGDRAADPALVDVTTSLGTQAGT